MITFGKWLEHARKSAGLTQEQLAKRAGCTRAYISSLEREVVESASNEPIKPSLKIVDAIARGLGIPAQIPRRLAGYHTPEAEKISEDEIRLLAHYRDLPPDRQLILFGIAHLLLNLTAPKSKNSDARFTEDDFPPEGTPVEFLVAHEG